MSTAPARFVVGRYSALISDELGSPTGFARFDVTTSGAWTGFVRIGGQRWSVRGAFSSDGHAKVTLARAGTVPLKLELLGVRGSLQATIEGGGAALTFTAPHCPWSTAQPTPNAGRYTLLLDPVVDSPTAELVPIGSGFAAMKISKDGRATVIGRMPDGVPFAGSSWLLADGMLPFDANMSAGADAFAFGNLTFRESAPLSDVAGELDWQRLPGERPQYPQGFAVKLEVTGSRYTPPGRTAVPLAVGATGTTLLALRGGNLPNAPLERSVILRPGRSSIVEPPVTLFAIDAATGTFYGRFLHPADGLSRTFRGAFLQKPNLGRGVFVGTSEAGAVTLTP
jgi:hypothetical protein